jgi:hypothetical protein
MSVLRLTPERYAELQKKAKKPPRKAAQNRAGEVVKPPKPPTHLKYRNRPTGGYSSVKEARRAVELKLMESAGLIRNLKEQVPFVLLETQRDENHTLLELPVRYVADFVYQERVGEGNIWKAVVEDVKSPASKTETYILKRKLMLKIHGIQIKEV